MSEDDKLGRLDRAVERLAKLLNSLGLNGTRLLWRWNRRRRRIGEAGLKTEILWRSARGRHKMCPSCRALVERRLATCPECGETLAGVRAPGIGRALSNLVPGISAATSLLMLVNGFWFLMMIMSQIRAGAEGGQVSLFSSFDIEMLARFGAGVSRPRALAMGAVTGGEWWRFVTPIFLHGGLLHFLFNSYLLLSLGPLVEEIYGTARFWTIYLGCGIAGSLASQLPWFTITVGASGAIMGLIGLLAMHGLRRGGVLGQSMKSLLMRLVVYSIVLELFFNIDHLNHAGGLACGAALALVVPHGAYRGRSEERFWQGLSLAGVLLVLFAFYQVAAFGRAAVGA